MLDALVLLTRKLLPRQIVILIARVLYESKKASKGFSSPRDVAGESPAISIPERL